MSGTDPTASSPELKGTVTVTRFEDFKAITLAPDGKRTSLIFETLTPSNEFRAFGTKLGEWKSGKVGNRKPLPVEFDATGLISSDGTLGAANGTLGALLCNYVGATGGEIVLTTSLTVNNATAANIFQYGGVISGAGSLIKQGAATLELRGANAYTGLTTVTAGTLRLGAYGAAAGLGTPGSGGGKDHEEVDVQISFPQRFEG